MKFSSLPMRTRRLAVAAGSVGVLVVGFVAYDRIFVAPRSELQRTIDQTKTSIFALQDALDDEIAYRTRLRDFGLTTLGGETDLVQHRLRTGLTRVAEQSGLGGIVVDAGDPQAIPNPAVGTTGVASSVKRALRSKPDFEVIKGSVVGSGTLEQATSALALLQSQPWIHRIDSFSLRPVGKSRDRFELRAEVLTRIARDLAPTDSTDPVLVPANVDLQSLARQVAARAMFSPPEAAPKPVVVAADPAGGVPAPPSPAVAFPPYEDWKVTGILTGRTGTSAILLNQRNGQSITLEKGGAVLDAVFVDVGIDTAIFEIAGKRYVVDNGSSLGARRPGG